MICGQLDLARFGDSENVYRPFTGFTVQFELKTILQHPLHHRPHFVNRHASTLTLRLRLKIEVIRIGP